MKKVIELVIIVIGMLLFTSCSEKGEMMKIELYGNPTTGYNWLYSIDNPDAIFEISNTYIPSNDVLDTADSPTGMGGIYTYIFKGLAEGNVKLSFNYQKEWEEESVYNIIYEIKVHKDLLIEVCKINGNYINKIIPKPILINNS